MKSFCYILMMLLTMSWFSSLMEVLPCDSEMGHGESAARLLDIKPFTSTGIKITSSSNDHTPHDCHEGACHFGHCAHGYPKTAISLIKNPMTQVISAHTPYSSLRANGSRWSLIRPPRSSGSSRAASFNMKA